MNTAVFFSAQFDDEKRGRERNIHHVELCVHVCGACVQNETEFQTDVEV